MKILLRTRRITALLLLLTCVCVVVYIQSVNFRLKDMMKRMQGGKSCDHVLQYIAENLEVKYVVQSNIGWEKNHHEIILTNEGSSFIPQGEWSIYFNHMFLPEEGHFRYRKTYHLPGSGFVLEHLDGALLKLTPSGNFEGISSDTSVVVNVNSPSIAARCYVLPRWYVSSPNCKPLIIKSTDDETLSFVNDFNHPSKWKRDDQDNSNPFLPSQRFVKYNVLDRGEPPVRILPTPISSVIDREKTVDLSTGDWVVCKSVPEFGDEIDKFGELFHLSVLPEKEPCPPTHAIRFIKSKVDTDEVPDSNEAYQLNIDHALPLISIQAPHSTGVFYALQTLKSLATNSKGITGLTLPHATIKDAPRFGYRGLHLDVARNFLAVDDVTGIIKGMAMYKLNKLHFHLSDDEGWRLEVPDLPELTQVGSRRCHTADEAECIFPALGSGPYDTKPGSGFYSTDEYKKILQTAADNHIQVIPEVDMPGHSHAAIKSMEARFHRFMKQLDGEKAQEFLLCDFDDSSPAMSVQHYRNNAMNPCMESTFRFVEKILDTLIDLHSEIQPIRTFHVGGDEVARNSWRDSPICRKFIESTDNFPNSHTELQEYFLRRVSQIVSKKNDISMGVWEDGALQMPQNEPFDKRSFHDVDVMAYAWNNANWKSKNAERSHRLANAGYKVILSMATHFYFDHPQEPDPEEVGLFWATRYSDDKNVFGFTPEELFANAKLDYSSVPYTAEESDRIIDERVKLDRPENIVGMQAQLWSELVRDVAVAHSQLFPRLIAFAERAWHKAAWEEGESRKLRYMKYQDWSEFANVVGYKELPRLKTMGIKYRIPPPGVRFNKLTLEICGLYPGFAYKMRAINNGEEASDWSECFNGQPMAFEDEEKCYEFVSSDGERTSRVIKYDPKLTERKPYL